MGGSINGGYPIAGWFLLGKIPLKWMMTGGTPILRNPQMFMRKNCEQTLGCLSYSPQFFDERLSLGLPAGRSDHWDIPLLAFHGVQHGQSNAWKNAGQSGAKQIRNVREYSMS